MRPLLYTTFFLLLTSCVCFGQDMHFSQFQYSPLNLNASNTGRFNGDHRFAASHRNQWSAVSQPYQTFTISYDRPVKLSGNAFPHHHAGIVINSDKAGDGDFGTLQALLSYSYLIAIGKDSLHFLSAGVQAGIVQRSVNFSSLTFDSQFDGDVFNPSGFSGESPSQNSFAYADVNVGLNWSSLFDSGVLEGGISLQHINKPNQTFYDGDKLPLPMRWQINLSPVFKAGESVTLLPAVLFMQQSKFSELMGGLEAKLNLKKTSTRKLAFGLGAYARLKDALIPAVALYYNNLRVGLSYDINTSALTRASNGRGGTEISAQYILKKIRTKLNRNVCCPVY